MKGKFVSYLRVSTGKQGRNGLGIEAQRTAVLDYLNGGRWQLLEEVVEVESGKDSDRPELARALALCRLHGATLLVAKLDRLARNLHFLTGLMEAGVDFVACDLPQANKLTVHILAAVAQAEAEAISARTKAALAAAKARGVKLGNAGRYLTPTVQRKASKRGAEVRHNKAIARARDLAPIIDEIRKRGITTLRGIAGELNRRGFPTARGGEWPATQVMRVLALSDTVGHTARP